MRVEQLTSPSRQSAGERRQSLSPCLPSSFFLRFDRWQTDRKTRVGSPDLGARAPSLPLPSRCAV